MKISKIKLIVIVIFLLAAFFRLYGLDWDQNQHLHPDERFLTMVTNSLVWPNNISEYLNSSTSPLNPHNKGWGLFVYGTFPLFFTKLLTDITGTNDYNNIALMGRLLSAFFDLGTLVLVYKIAKNILISKSKNFPLLSTFFYALSVLPIQLSHFYAVDTYLTFFITLTFFILIKLINNRTYNCLLGISFGLAIASKISALLFLPVIGLGYLFFFCKQKSLGVFLLGGIFVISCYFTVRLAQPYLFQNPNLFDLSLNQKVLNNWKELKSYDNPDGWFPPSVQWITTKPFLYPLKNLVFWGLGLPQALISLTAIVFLLFYLLKKPKSFNQPLVLALVWILLLFFYQGAQFSKNMRYFYPFYPFLALLSGWFISQTITFSRTGDAKRIFVYVLMFSCLIYPLAFVAIYTRPHSRIAASEWIYQNIPPSSVLTSEYWDDSLPLPLPDYQGITYQNVTLPLYDADTPAKWEKINAELLQVDYLILSSNRLYGSIMTTPKIYPQTCRFYEDLFSGKSGFTKIAEFTSRPNLPLPFLKLCLTPPFVRYGIVAKEKQECPLPGISFVDDYADESFTVYDHPKVLIFQRAVNNSGYFLTK